MTINGKVILGIAGAFLAVGLACLAATAGMAGNTANVIQTGFVMGYLAVASVVVGFLAYPGAKADADCKRKACSDDK